MKEIKRGAEAVLSLDMFQGNTALFKERISKGYRIKELDDAIRKQRTKKEARLLEMSRRSGVLAPRVLKQEDFTLVMEYLGKNRIKDLLNDMPKEKREKVYGLIGNSVANLHSAGIVHGDLTTSNMMLKEEKGEIKIFIIDFGLGKFSQKIEDQAVDLFLLYEALKSTHFAVLEEAWRNILNTYQQNYTNASEVLKRLEKIKKRRRYLGG